MIIIKCAYIPGTGFSFVAYDAEEQTPIDRFEAAKAANGSDDNSQEFRDALTRLEVPEPLIVEAVEQLKGGSCATTDIRLLTLHKYKAESVLEVPGFSDPDILATS